MKRILLAFLLLAAFASDGWSAAAEITPVEVSSVADTDTLLAGSGWHLITTTAGVTFPNNDLTFVMLYDTLITCTATVAAPASTIRIPGYGIVTLSAITVALTAANNNVAIFKIPTRYNVAGKATITVSDASKMKVKVCYLGKE